uniref:Uncharacterized protein n=1 Tax=Noctiluca scintillans TaxID=2966 RepID=A0A7S0ZQL1_NOCSC
MAKAVEPRVDEADAATQRDCPRKELRDATPRQDSPNLGEQEALSPGATSALVRSLLGIDSEASPTSVAGFRRFLSPLDIHFSQAHIRPDFQDGAPVEESVAQIRSELCSEALDLSPALSTSEGWWLLRPPFPEIQVIQWRCKLRNEDGSIKVDAEGSELYHELEWYTLDNRRLYCLQKAAVALWPVECRCLVTVVRQQDGNCREFRKFRTPDCGRTVGIGHKETRELPRWSWRQTAGLPEAPLPLGSPIARSPNKRRERRGQGNVTRSRSGRRLLDDECDDDDGDRWALLQRILLFVLVYATLRLALQVGRRIMDTSVSEA